MSREIETMQGAEGVEDSKVNREKKKNCQTFWA